MLLYKLYLRSIGWKLTCWLRKRNFCDKCGTNIQPLDLHHDEYRWHNDYQIARWIIPNMSDNMRTLCRRCHRLEHNKNV